MSTKLTRDELEKLFVEAHWLRFDSFFSPVQEFNELNSEVIEDLYKKHSSFVSYLEKRSMEE